MEKVTVIGITVVVFGAACSAAYGLENPPGAEGEKPGAIGDFDPVSIMVRFEPEATAEQRQAVFAAACGQIRRQYRTIPGLVSVVIGIPVPEALAAIRGMPGVRYAEPNHFVHLAGIPNDVNFPRLWGMHNTGQTVNGDPGILDADIDAPEAWDLFTGDPNMVIAVLDTGVSYQHPELVSNMWTNPGEIAGNGVDDDQNGYIDDVRGWDFWNNDNDPIDDHGHGTFCAGVIGARGNNVSGITGVNWRCKVMALKFFSGNIQATIEGAVAALDYAVSNGAPISSHSWYTSSPLVLEDAVDAAHAAGHLIVAAAANFATDNDVTPYYPASFPHDNVIAVGGCTNDDTLAWFSNYGAVSVDLLAPALNVYSCWINNGYLWGDGTSAATPHVAGAAALVLGRSPGKSCLQIRGEILATVRPVAAAQGRCVTGGVLNVGQALRRSICAADFDYSGFVDTDDFDAFVHAFEAGTGGADIDGSGFVDTDDYDAFVEAFEKGC
ncbi:MAG: S8 family serine peptidase [Phycisphaerales bacterium]|nr:S8 family serine peptidase [Phycisphaerales bacterium]